MNSRRILVRVMKTPLCSKLLLFLYGCIQNGQDCDPDSCALVQILHLMTHSTTTMLQTQHVQGSNYFQFLPVPNSHTYMCASPYLVFFLILYFLASITKITIQITFFFWLLHVQIFTSSVFDFNPYLCHIFDLYHFQITTKF